MFNLPESGDYKPLSTLSLLTIIALAINGLSNVLMVIPSLGLMFSPEHTLELGDGTGAQTWFLLIGVIFLVSFPVSIATIVLFLVWLYRAHKNLLSLKPTHLDFSPGWAVGWWFIPFLNLVKPYQVVREVWWESDPEIPDGPGFLSASLHYAPTYMGFWWGFWIASNILSNVASRVFDPENTESLPFSGAWFFISSLVTAIAAVLAIVVVRDISRRQAERRENLQRLYSETPPPPPVFGATEIGDLQTD